jgi:glycosyltransferase involved in cell wall biosynthesis
MVLTQEEVEKRVLDSYELPNRVLEVIPEPMVTVCTSTYQHGPYIKDCIEGVLMQKTTFPVEYIIGEDFSTDGTREIVFEYAKKYPDKIRVMTAEYNVGAKANGTRCRRASRGKYIAICEGDDYWISSDKLQKQINFLEANPEYSMCFHNAIVYDELCNKKYIFNKVDPIFNPKKLNTDRTVEGYELLNNWIVPTASTVYRSNYLIPNDFVKTNYGDIFLFLYLSTKGKIYYFNEISSVYRKLHQGLRRIYKFDLDSFIDHYELLINNFISIKYLKSSCEKYIATLFFSKALQALKKRNFSDSIKYFYKFILAYLRFVFSPKASSFLQGSAFIFKVGIKDILSK